MSNNFSKNRVVIINEDDLGQFEFMLWMYDIKLIDTFGCMDIREPKHTAAYFRCSDEKYQKIYEKMDSLGIWKGDFVNPKIEGRYLRCDGVNELVEDVSKRYLIIGV